MFMILFVWKYWIVLEVVKRNMEILYIIYQWCDIIIKIKFIVVFCFFYL